MGEDAVEVVRMALFQALMIALPILGSGLVVGLIISLFQAVTQIQEQTLSFVPKILAVLLVLALVAPWMGEQLVRFAQAALSGSF